MYLLEATGLENLFAGATSVITNIISLLGTVSTALLSNEIFQIVIGVVIFGIVMGVVFTLVRKLRRRGK